MQDAKESDGNAMRVLARTPHTGRAEPQVPPLTYKSSDLQPKCNPETYNTRRYRSRAARNKDTERPRDCFPEFQPWVEPQDGGPES